MEIGKCILIPGIMRHIDHKKKLLVFLWWKSYHLFSLCDNKNEFEVPTLQRCKFLIRFNLRQSR